jgi:hypothetical protein
VVRSSSKEPMICTPMGRPDGERPIGATVAGRPGGVASVPLSRPATPAS